MLPLVLNSQIFSIFTSVMPLNHKKVRFSEVKGKKSWLLAGIAVALAFASCSGLKEIEFFTPEEMAEMFARWASSSSSEESSSSSSAPTLLQCGSGTYNSETHFCLGGNTITELCGGKTYSVYQFCDGGKVYGYCNGVAYNSAEYICCDNKQEDIKKYGCCDNSRYTLATHFCHTDGNTYSCSDKPYNPATHFCDDRVVDKLYKYVKIGEQVWMAENLNYEAANSACYDDKPTNCDKYGRLYDWVTAMGFDDSCNSIDCSKQVGAKHRGICPSGWHIPSSADWETLISYVESDKGCSGCTGKHLKSVSGWDWNDYDGNSGNGLDTYGFSALPGGIGYFNGTFNGVGGSGIWWTISEDIRGDIVDEAYSCSMFFVYDISYCSSNPKFLLPSVRCVRD